MKDTLECLIIRTSSPTNFRGDYVASVTSPTLGWIFLPVCFSELGNIAQDALRSLSQDTQCFRSMGRATCVTSWPSLAVRARTFHRRAGDFCNPGWGISSLSPTSHPAAEPAPQHFCFCVFYFKTDCGSVAQVGLQFAVIMP